MGIYVDLYYCVELDYPTLVNFVCKNCDHAMAPKSTKDEFAYSASHLDIRDKNHVIEYIDNYLDDYLETVYPVEMKGLKFLAISSSGHLLLAVSKWSVRIISNTSSDKDFISVPEPDKDAGHRARKMARILGAENPTVSKKIVIT